MMTYEKKSSLIADYIRPAVYAKYRTQADAAEDIGIDQPILSRLCSGKRPSVSNAVIEKICDKLGLDKSVGVLKLSLTKKQKLK